jgi:hypothetical protein
MSMAGVAVSVVNFIVAFGKDPSDYCNVYCRHQSNEFDHATTIFLSTTAVGVDNDDYDVVVRFLEGHETILFDPASCPLYTKIDWSIFVCFFVGLIVLSTSQWINPMFCTEKIRLNHFEQIALTSRFIHYI